MLSRRGRRGFSCPIRAYTFKNTSPGRLLQNGSMWNRREPPRWSLLCQFSSPDIPLPPQYYHFWNGQVLGNKYRSSEIHKRACRYVSAWFELRITWGTAVRLDKGAYVLKNQDLYLKLCSISENQASFPNFRRRKLRTSEDRICRAYINIFIWFYYARRSTSYKDIHVRG